MLFLPIGRDDSIVRRQPLVSYAIIAVNVLVFVLFNVLAAGPDQQAIETKWKEIVSLLESRPYLVIPREVERFLEPHDRQHLTDARNTMRSKGELPAPWIQQRHQAALERLTSELSSLVSDSPVLGNAYVPAKGGSLTLITSMFIHGDLMHLVGNLLFFFVVGPFVEDVFGRPLFTLLYLSGGIFATLTHAWQNPGSLAPLVGASGAIAAIMGAYLARFFASRIQFFFLPIIFLPRFHFRFFIPAFVVLPLWFAEQFFLATREGMSSVAWWAHVGGFAYGLGMAVLIRVGRVEQRWIDPAVNREISWSQDERLIDATRLQEQGRYDEAERTLSGLLRSQPRNLDARRAAYDFALEGRRWQQASEQGNRLLEMYIDAGETDLSYALIREFTGSSPTIFPEKFYARAASFLQKEREYGWAMELYREIELRSEDTPHSLRALVQMAELTRRTGDVMGTEQLLKRALRHPLCSGEWKERVDRDLARLKE